MNCFSEFAYSVYVDGESPAEETRAIEAHLETCASCRAMVHALRGEVGAIAVMMAETRNELDTLPEWQPASPSRLILGALGAAAGVILSLRAVLVGLGHWGLSQLGLLEPVSAALDWINPANWTAQMNLFFTGVFYVVNKGAAMLPWLLTAIASVVIALALAGVGYWLAKRRPTRGHSLAMLQVIAGVVLAGVAAPKAHAVEIHKLGNGSFTLERGKVVNDTLMIGGESAVIDGDVNGDVIFGGRKLVINGTVRGDVAAGTQITEINGTVTGNVISFSQWLSLGGKIGGSVYSWSQEFRGATSSTIGGNLLNFSADCDVAGQVERDAMVFTGKSQISGKVGQNFKMYGDDLTVNAGAVIGGDLEAHLEHPERVRIESGSRIAGKQSIEKHSRESADDNSRYVSGKFYFWQMVQLLAAMLTGTLLLLLCPKFYRDTVDAVGATAGSLGRSLGLGFAIMVATPVAIALICATLVGIPIGLLVLMLYLVGFYFAKIFVGAMVGQAMLQRGSHSRQDVLLALFVGLAVFFFATNLPYAVGTILHFLTMCVGLGAFGYRLVKGSPTLNPQLTA